MALTAFSVLATTVTGIVSDSSFSDAEVRVEIVKGQWDIAGRVLLPELEFSSDITTSTSNAYKALPSTYHRHLFRCYNATRYRKVKIYKSLALLEDQFTRLGLAGEIYGVAIRASNLCYQYIPGTAQTLTLSYFAEPTELSADGDTATEIPEQWADDLLIYYACWKIFRDIEEDESGKSPQTAKYKGLYEEKIAELQAFIGPFATGDEEMPDTMDYDSLYND